MDVIPRFALPTCLITAYKQRHNQLLDSPEEIDTRTSIIFRNPTVVQIAQSLRDVQTLMRAEASRRDLFGDTIFPGFNLSPICYELLVLRSHLDKNDTRGALIEAFRLSAIIYLYELRALFSYEPAAEPKYAGKLQNLLYYSAIDWASADPILLWVLAVALTSRNVTPEQRAWLGGTFRTVVETQSVDNFEDLKSRIEQIVWDEAIMMRQTEALRLIFEI